MTISKDIAPSEWQKRRLQRIARQEAKRKARREALHNAREVAEQETDEAEDEDDAPAAPRKKKGKQSTAPAKAARPGLLPSIPAMNTNRYTSVIIWLIGAYLTRAFILQIGVADELATPIAFLLQWLLTRAESPLWRGHGYPRMAMIATAVDGAINTGGTWVYTKNIGNTDFWKMIQFAANDPTLTPSIGTQIAVAIGVGLLTAAAAEYYWNLPSK
jgi:hypothetical protein